MSRRAWQYLDAIKRDPDTYGKIVEIRIRRGIVYQKMRIVYNIKIVTSKGNWVKLSERWPDFNLESVKTLLTALDMEAAIPRLMFLGGLPLVLKVPHQKER